MKRIPLIGVLIVKNNKVLLEKRKATDPFGAGELWIIGGHIEKGETAELALAREMKEELGIEPAKFFALCKLPWERDGKIYSVQYFVCTKWEGKIKNKAAEKLLWLNENQVEKLDEDIDKIALKKFFKGKK